jgi:hypothetical protein
MDNPSASVNDEIVSNRVLGSTLRMRSVTGV